jgi:hypothetical protein
MTEQHVSGSCRGRQRRSRAGIDVAEQRLQVEVSKLRLLVWRAGLRSNISFKADGYAAA